MATSAAKTCCQVARNPLVTNGPCTVEKNSQLLECYTLPVPTKPCACQPNCSCCKTKTNKPVEVQMCKYIQPALRTSFKPPSTYIKGKVKMEDSSIYRASYRPNEFTKSKQYKPNDNLPQIDGKVSCNTTHKLSYQPHLGVVRTVPYTPGKGNLLGVGPMSDMTTHKHDYVAKPIEKRSPFLPPETINETGALFSDKTTFRQSYMPINLHGTKVKSFRPEETLSTTTGKVDHNTVHRLSYIPYPTSCIEIPPWNIKGEYIKPDVPMYGASVYQNSYMVPGDYEKSLSCKKDSPYVRSTTKMEDKTTYRYSFQTGEIAKPEPSKKPLDSINAGEGKFDGNSCYRLSYKKYFNACPAMLIRPMPSTCPSKDRMADLSTHKHDYVVKPMEKVDAFLPPLSKNVCNAPFTDTTTNRLSFRLYDPKEIIRVKPSRMINEIQSTTGVFDGNTIQKLSYKPCAIEKPDEKPWVQNSQYVVPNIRMNCNTIYRGSFEPPGAYVPCSAKDPNCIPCLTTPTKDDHNSGDPNSCCSRCCCNIPVAVC